MVTPCHKLVTCTGIHTSQLLKVGVGQGVTEDRKPDRPNSFLPWFPAKVNVHSTGTHVPELGVAVEAERFAGRFVRAALQLF